ncbi:MAG: hypothetical protein R3195_14410 [Gemmatimonadota bacterium]|nr:hypothetical protein [Gemmatimonadota bacterium]
MGEAPLSSFASNWRDAIRDVVLIVVSILIAFGLEAWWDARGSRAHARDVESALIAEFQTNLELFRADSLRLAEAIAATTTLLANFSPEPPTISSDSVSTLVARSFRQGRGFTPTVGVSATLDAGEIAGLVGDSTAVLLARWRRIGEISDSWADRMEGSTTAIVRSWAASGISVASFSPSLPMPPSRLSRPPTAILTDSQTEGLLAERAIYLNSISDRIYPETRGLARAILESLGSR